MRTEQLQHNIQQMRQRLSEAAARWAQPVQICAVTKTIPIDAINSSFDAGVRIIGENRVQEALQKFPALNPNFELHMIGQLQTNKVKYVLDIASMVQSLDRIELARELDRRAQPRGMSMPALVQVNIASEPQKAGVAECELERFVRACSGLPGIRIQGLMAIMPISEDPEQMRPYFRRMRIWFERLRAQGIANVEMNCLSMGMSGDYVVAAEEGATMVRVGSLLYKER